MTRISVMFLLLFALLTGCGQAETTETPDEPPTSLPVEEPAPPTKADVLDFFAADPDYENCEVIDCVLADDGAYGLIGVVQYINEWENPCCLSFVTQDGCCFPITLCSDGIGEIPPDSQLTYLGNGTVAFSMQETFRDGKLLDCEVAFSQLEDGYNFEVSSQERS